MPKTYANRIRALRNLRGWHLSDLAERLGCDPSDVGKWERGDRVPSLFTALKLAQLLGQRVEDLFWDLFHDAWGTLRAVHRPDAPPTPGRPDEPEAPTRP